MALTQVSTGGVKDDAVTSDKVANAINSSIAANTAKTGVGTNVVQTAHIADNAITQAKINVPISNRNLIINGAMLVAQRGTSSTISGYGTIDRFHMSYGGEDEDPTQAQVNVASGTTPYTLGFRKAAKITNGNQTSTVGTTDFSQFLQRLEAQDIANSGWNYLSSSSYITLSFWVKSSVAQVFTGSIRSLDGTSYTYKFDTPSLTANTWTKVTKTIPGNSNLQFDNDTGVGLDIYIFPYLGTGYSDANSNTETWVVSGGGNYGNDNASTWWTTNDATMEFTGVQLEVGSVATDFEHRSFGQELALCQRYLFKNINESGELGANYGKAYSASELFASVRFPVAMRATPTVTAYGNGGTAGQVHKLGNPDISYTSIDRLDVYGGMRLNSSSAWATGNTDMYSFTFQAEAEL